MKLYSLAAASGQWVDSCEPYLTRFSPVCCCAGCVTCAWFCSRCVSVPCSVCQSWQTNKQYAAHVEQNSSVLFNVRRVLFSVCYVHRAVFSVTCAVLCYMWRVLLCSLQACLVMDPAQRPDCGSLLQMELFTQDQFSVTHTQEIRRRLQQVRNRL